MPYQSGLDHAIRLAGLNLVTYPGWTTHGGSTFDPIGVMVHHTGPWSTISGMVQLCRTGYTGLSGPLCHVVLDPHGTCHLIAAGRANHAGTGSWRGVTAGNTRFFGIEAIHSGSAKDPWPRAQLDAYYKLTAALCKLRAIPASMVCGHKEWAPTRKIDPININMNDFRATVASLLGSAPTPSGVKPMYDPPLGPIAAVWQDTDGKVLAAVSPEGYVYTWGMPYYGGVAGRTWWGTRRAARIGPRPDGAPGYRITATNGQTYDLPNDTP